MSAGASERRAGPQFWLPAATALALDLVSKWVAAATLPAFLPVPIFDGWFQLQLVHNRVAAFGVSLGTWSRIILVLVSLGIMGLILHWARTPGAAPLGREALGLIFGGALGNLLERIANPRGVTDFLQLQLGPLHLPVFNVADIAVTLGALALAATILRSRGLRPGA